MCILFIAVNKHPEFPLIIAANRDEFYKRPTTSSHFWDTTPQVLAGVDEEAGGTWMGINEQGYLSALTNIRAPELQKADAISRGFLVKDYLLSMPTNHEFEEQLHTSKDNYNGYNLLYGHWKDLHVYNNFEDRSQPLTSGFYGLSNANLNSPWPKINRGVQALESYCQSHNTLVAEELFALLRDDTKAEDHLLPETGVPYEWEKHLSSIFINIPEYGTRSSTILTVSKESDVNWQERTFNQNGVLISEQHYQFQMDKK